MSERSFASLWFEMASSMDPVVFACSFVSTVLACLAIQLGPHRVRAFCALPFAPAFFLCLSAATAGRPDLYLSCSMLFCPLLLWMGRPDDDDPMRLILTDSEGYAESAGEAWQPASSDPSLGAIGQARKLRARP